MNGDTLTFDVLRLNKLWEAISVISVRTALEDLFSGTVTALSYDEGQLIPCNITDWLNLPIRDNDDYVTTVNRKIRAPRVVVCINYNKLFIKEPKLTLKSLRERDKDTCIYTGRKLKPSEMSMEHIIPDSHGGQKIWENIGLADRDINSKRRNLPLEKAGLKLRYKPFAPKPKKPCHYIQNKNNYFEWSYFIKP